MFISGTYKAVYGPHGAQWVRIWAMPRGGYCAVKIRGGDHVTAGEITWVTRSGPMAPTKDTSQAKGSGVFAAKMQASQKNFVDPYWMDAEVFLRMYKAACSFLTNGIAFNI